MPRVRVLSVGLLLLAIITPARGAEPDRAALARKAFAVLQANCHRCHGKDGNEEGGFGFILDFKALVARKYVVPGAPAKSKLFKRVTNPADPMPPEEEKLRPSRDDIAALRAWIEAGAPDHRSPSARRFLAESDLLRAIAEDLATVDERHRPFTRYLSLAHLHNQNRVAEEMQLYRGALAKLVNSLSWEPEIVAPQAVDSERTVFRIDLRDYRWSPEIWKRLEHDFPYAVRPDDPLARAICSATGAELPYLRADWFAFAASRPPLYHDILQLPKTDAELERELKVDVAANVQADKVARAGFNGSGVSRNNRLIERHRSGYGAYWKSYDFGGNVGRQNLFAHPLGPGDDPEHFAQDGGEIIFNLPNGLQGYMLVDGRGRRIDEGPTKIVSVKNRPDPTVINGVSCMGCHARGMIDKADQVRAHAEKNPDAFSETDLRIIRALYPPAPAFRALLDRDAERFRKAVAATGASPDGPEPVSALAARFEREVDLPAAAAEVGLPPETFAKLLERSPRLAQRLGSLRVEGGTVQRQEFAGLFGEAVEELGLGVSLFRLNRELDAASEAVRRNPKDADAHFRRGNAAFDKGDYAKAADDYGEAIRLGFTGASAYLHRGMARANLGDFGRAVADYDEAIRRDPAGAAAFHNRALAHARQGDHRQSLADFTEAIRLSPRDPALYLGRAFVHAQRGRHAQAADDCTEALRLAPSPLAFRRRAEALRQSRDFARAADDLNAALRLSPEDAAALNDLARLLATCPEDKLRDGKRAVECATRACERTGWRHTPYLDTLAAAHAEAGDFAAALRWARRALELAPDGQKEALRAQLRLYEANEPLREPAG